MDYKDKYNKLVEDVKVLQEENPSDEGIRNWVNDNVPELAESKDEKVRKWLYGYFHGLFPTWILPDITCDEILAWLEKQGTSYTKRDVDDAYIEGMAFAKDELEKQGQKPAWSEEDEVRLQACIDILQAKSIMGKVDTIQTNWLKSLKQRYTWKPSDEQMRALHDMNLIGNISYAGQGQVLIELYNDLKRL